MTIYKQFQARMANDVKSGQITREAADKRLAGLKKKLWADSKKEGKDGDDKRKAIYLKAESEIKKAVQSGEITRAQAAERLANLKKKLWGNDTKQKPGSPSKKPQKSPPKKKLPPKPKAK